MRGNLADGSDIPWAWVSSCGVFGVVVPGSGLVVEGAGLEAAVEDADEAVG
jgi:hypothetical protein